MVSRWMSLCVHLSVSCASIRFSFLDDNLSKHQWIFFKLGVCIDIVEIWFGVAIGQISSIFYGVICIDIVEIWFGNANGQILTELSA